MNTGDVERHMGSLHWNIWCVDEPSNSTLQGIGWKWAEQVILSSLVLMCNSMKLLLFYYLTHAAYRDLFLASPVFLSPITTANKTQKGQKTVALCCRRVTSWSYTD